VSSDAPIRQRAVWDIILSVVFLVLAVGGALVGAVSQVFILAFTDYCPQTTCHINEAVNSVFVTWAVIAVVLLASIVATIVRLIRRRRGWWVALIGAVVVYVGALVGFVLYVSAVGYGS
jgi:uncharacterized BrkB/YihY/UPF0761 family membrane protein